MTSAVETVELRKRFGGAEVLAGVDLRVETGTIVALLGPNGAGKTTLINILSTLVRADGGTATVGGIDVELDPARVRSLISVTGQSAAVDEVLTGEENLRMMGRLGGLRRREARDRAQELLGRFGLDDAARKRVGAYSGGMRRRLDLAISLVVPAPILFLDEPTTGLDLRSRHALWEVVRSLRTSGTTVLVTTQYLEEADQLADRVVVIRGGRLVAEGTPAELKARVGGEVVERTGPDGEILGRVPTDGTVDGLRAALDELDASETYASSMPAVFSGADTVAIHRPSLDDVFLQLTEPDRVLENVEGRL